MLLPQYRKLTENRERIWKLEKAKKEYDEKQHRIEIERTNVNNAKTALENRLTEQKIARERIIQRISSTENFLKGLEELENSAEILGKETLPLSALRQENLEKTGEAQSLSQKIAIMEENQREKANEWTQIENIGVGAECPHCMQELTTEHYNLLKEKYRNEINYLKNQIKNLSEEREKIETNLDAMEKKIHELTEKEANLQNLQIKISELLTRKEGLRESLEAYEEVEERIIDIQKNLENQEYALQSKQLISKLIVEVNNLETSVKQYKYIRKEIEKLEEKEVEKKYIENRNLSERKTEYQEKDLETEKRINGTRETVRDHTEIITTLEKEADKYRESEKDRNRIQEELTKANSELASTETIITQNISRIQEAEKRINQHKEDLDRHTKNILKAEEHNIHKTWLQEAFMPAISSIERNVLMTLNHEFNTLFKKWFKTLIESEEIEAIVDEDFTPIIDQAGYELDVESLSGGEKTSVALAYRLALNTVVKRVTNTMKSNLLILDEPTDGFSKEQIYKMRDILTDLNCEQVIIVSHERELESVADHIYQVQKDGTISTVTEPRT